MKIKYNINICDSNKHKSELMIHFTKVCPNNCSFCIDKLNLGVNTKKPDIDKIIKTVDKYKDKVSNISISGGEPFVFMDDLLYFVNWIKENTELKILVITSVPNICYKEKEKFFKILDKCDNIQISLQHYNTKLGDSIRGSESDFDRNNFYKEILDHCGTDKILGSINILKPYFEYRCDILRNIMLFNKLGFKNIKICEMFDADNLYIDIPKTLGIKMNSPFASGCKTEVKDVDKLFKMDPELHYYHFQGHLYIKRTCFYRTKLQKASVWDLIKVCTRWIFARKFFFGVVHENGEIHPYWV